MANPWDVPPFPAFGDSDLKLLYAAKGSAVSAWERIEVSLRYIYAIFSGEPWDKVEAYRKYGEQLNFNGRVEALDTAASSYFVRNCDQGREGVYGQLIAEIRHFQPRRNEITHSVVAFRERGGANEYFLLPPEYYGKKFDANDKAKFVYTSAEINVFNKHFCSLGFHLDLFAAALRVR